MRGLDLTWWEVLLIHGSYYVRQARRKVITALGGHDPSIVRQLVYSARRFTQELEGQELPPMLATLHARMKGQIKGVEPELGRIWYGQ